MTIEHVRSLCWEIFSAFLMLSAVGSVMTVLLGWRIARLRKALRDLESRR